LKEAEKPRVQKKKDEVSSADTLKKTSKICPGCNSKLEKNG